MTNKEKNINKINTILLDCSEIDWNGYEAMPIPKRVIDRAIKLITELPEDYQPTFVAPVANESIQIEYKNDNCYLELEIHKNHICGYVDIINFNDMPFTDKNLLAFTTDDVLDYVKKYYIGLKN